MGKEGFEGDEIGGKTLGLIGVGNIGKEVAKRASALGMTVLAYDPYVKTVDDVKWSRWMSAGASGLHQPAPAQDERVRQHGRQGPNRENEDRRADRQLRTRRHRR